MASFGAEHAWLSSTFPGCTYASPVWVTSQGMEQVLGVGQLGKVAGIDPQTGEEIWSVQLTTVNTGETIELLSTPAVVNDRYVVLAWQERDGATTRRLRHRIGVVDLETRAVSDAFPTQTLSASVPAYAEAATVDFDSQWELQRGTLLAVPQSDLTLGLVYVPVGNGPSDQPFHGWVFELDMDAWQSGGAAIANVMVTTAENGCGPPGNRSATVCGGGVWNAAGLFLSQPTEGGPFELFAATGNGRQDLDVGAYAHSVLRLTRGLAYDPGCDSALCADFDEVSPSPECQSSCEDLSMARLMPGEAPLAPESGACDGLTFLECLGQLDGDLGANAPVIVQPAGGPRVIVQPGKDGGLYLFDAEHMGTLYQRVQARAFCGTPDDPCAASWTGMFVTQPAVSEVDGNPVVIVASLMLDSTHASGISAYEVVMQDGAPRLVSLWDVPDASSTEARQAFRDHPGRPVVAQVDGEDVVFVVEVRRDALSGNPPGYLWGVRVRDGEVLVRTPITDAGQRYAVPLVHDDMLYLSTCPAAATTDGHIEAFRLRSM